MAKQGEIDYLKKLGPKGVEHAVNKPFSDQYCDINLMAMGAIMALLPQPPARLMDVGCGTGWTSLFFARRGFDVVGVDIAADMIDNANLLKQRQGVHNVRFVVGDYEDIHLDELFDCAVFYDSLHHAIDEESALRMVAKHLRPGGVCVTSEPGTGHAVAEGSVQAREKFDVTEKDMPPHWIMSVGKKVGFDRFHTYPNAHHLKRALYNGPGWTRWDRLKTRTGVVGKLASLAIMAGIRLGGERHGAIVVLEKKDRS